MDLLILRRKDSRTRNHFLGDTSGPYIWGKEKHTPGVSGSQEELESLATVSGLNRSEGLCGVASSPALPRISCGGFIVRLERCSWPKIQPQMEQPR